MTSSRLELVELTHSNAIKSSPFFNIFANISLRLFSPEESRDLISRSLRGTPVTFSESEVGHVLDLAGPHPYFPQAASWALYDSYQRGLDEKERTGFMRAQFRQEAVPQLVDYWDNSDDYEKIVRRHADHGERRQGRDRDRLERGGMGRRGRVQRAVPGPGLAA